MSEEFFLFGFILGLIAGFAFAAAWYLPEEPEQ